MPIMKCTKNGKSGYKWGRMGACFVGPEGKQKAEAQARAILSSQAKRKKRG